MSNALARLNALAPVEAEAELLACCGSTRWAREVAARRPFRGEQDLFETADSVWRNLDEADWLEAFRAHPKIGERKAARATGADAERWAEDEQRGASLAARDTLDELARANLDYEQRFGFIYIVCATGKSADEMLAILRERLGNDAETELRVAAEEQRKITQLRLGKLLKR
jgi:OHCU decarboxylase